MTRSRELPPYVYATNAKKGGKPFKTYVLLPTGKKQWARFHSVREALSWRAAAVESVARGEAPPAPVELRSTKQSGYRTFTDVAEEWFAHHYSGGHSGSTATDARRALRKWVLPVLGHRTINALTTADIEDLARHLSSGLSHAVATRYLWLARATLQYAAGRGWIAANPAAGVVVPNRARSETERAGDLYLTLTDTFNLSGQVREEWRLGVWIQRLCGLRVGELFGLQLGDVDHGLRVLHVRKQGGLSRGHGVDDRGFTGRTKTPAGVRVVGIPDLLYDLLVDHTGRFLDGTDETARLMPSLLGGWRYDGYASAVTTASRRLGLLDSAGHPTTTHALRKAFTTDLDRVLDDRTVSQLVGHEVPPERASRLTARIYVLDRREIDRARAGAEVFDPLLHEHLKDGLSVADEYPEPEWVPLLHAAAELGYTPAHVRTLAREGALRLVTYRPPHRGKHAAVVSRDSMDRFLMVSSGHVGLTEAARLLGQQVDFVARIIKVLDLPVRGPSGKDRVRLTLEDFERLKLEVDARAKFLSVHLLASEAARELGIHRNRVSRMVATGVLPASSQEPPASLKLLRSTPTTWIRREDVLRLAESLEEGDSGSRSTSRTAGLLSPTEVASRTGLSYETVIKCARAGTVPSTRLGKRFWLDPSVVTALRGRQRGEFPMGTTRGPGSSARAVSR